MPIPRANLVGRVFGDMTVLADAGNNKHGQSTWLCLCACGKNKVVGISHLKDGHVQSCGCLRSKTNTRLKSTNVRAGRFTCSKCKKRKLLKERAGGRGNYRCIACNREYHNGRYADNPEKYREASARWRAAHPGLAAQQCAQGKRNDPARYLWRLAKRRAAALGVPFTIQVEDLSIPDKCPVLGIELVPVLSGTGTQLPGTPSVDRLDPKLGYVPGNVTVISWRANSLKKDGSLMEFRKLVRWMKSKKEG